jgi:hypothetical protein
MWLGLAFAWSGLSFLVTHDQHLSARSVLLVAYTFVVGQATAAIRVRFVVFDAVTLTHALKHYTASLLISDLLGVRRPRWNLT